MSATAPETRVSETLQPAKRRRVLIIGGGFGGLNAALGLAKSQTGVPVDITLIDRKNFHTFQPLLYQVALAVLSPADIAQPIRSVLREYKNVDVLMDEVTTIDKSSRRIELKSGATLEYDFLIVATGSTHSYFGHNEWAALAPGLKTIEDATEIRRRVLLAFELAERTMLETGTHPALNFVIIGGGPTGVELAGAISDIARLYLAKDFRHINPSDAQVLILEGSPKILGAYPEDLQRKAAEQLASMGVRIRLNAKVTDIQPGYVVVSGGNVQPSQTNTPGEEPSERIDSVVTLWAAGVEASPLGRKLGLPTDSKGCVVVDQHLNPEGHPEIFVLGDLAHLMQDGKRVPGVAQPAMQMGNYAAKRIASLLSAESLRQSQTLISNESGQLSRERHTQSEGFRYFDKGDMATIGRKAAVANIVWPFKAHLSGFPAWISWLVIHVFFLINFRSRISVIGQWAWTYLVFQDGVRLITGPQNLPGWDRSDDAAHGLYPHHETTRPISLD